MTKRTTFDTGWNQAGCREFDERHCEAMNGTKGGVLNAKCKMQNAKGKMQKANTETFP
jgi:hypothetical protein